MQAFQTSAGERLRAFPDKNKEAFLFGMAAAQSAYNAANLRDADARDQQISALRNLSTAMSPAISAKLAAVVSARDDWHALNQAATILTLALMMQAPKR